MNLDVNGLTVNWGGESMVSGDGVVVNTEWLGTDIAGVTMSVVS